MLDSLLEMHNARQLAQVTKKVANLPAQDGLTGQNKLFSVSE